MKGITDDILVFGMNYYKAYKAKRARTCHSKPKPGKKTNLPTREEAEKVQKQTPDPLRIHSQTKEK